MKFETFMKFVSSDANRTLLINQLKFELQIPHIVKKNYISNFVKSNIYKIALMPDLMPLLTCFIQNSLDLSELDSLFEDMIKYDYY